jgi:transcriptional regulator with XRE-family HTH domain
LITALRQHRRLDNLPWRMPPAREPDADLAAVLREARESRGRSQEAVAHEAGMTVGALGRIERAQADPAWSRVSEIAAALGLSLAELGARIDSRRDGVA